MIATLILLFSLTAVDGQFAFVNKQAGRVQANNYQCRCDYDLINRQLLGLQIPSVAGHYQNDFNNYSAQGLWYAIESTDMTYKCPVFMEQPISDIITAKVSRLPNQLTCDVTINSGIGCRINDSSWISYWTDGTAYYNKVIDANYDRSPRYALLLRVSVDSGQQMINLLSSDKWLDSEVIKGLHYRLKGLGLGYLESRLQEVSQKNCCEDNCKFGRGYYNRLY